MRSTALAAPSVLSNASGGKARTGLATKRGPSSQPWRKIQTTVDNARAMTSASPSLAELSKSYESTRKRAPRSLADLPTSTPEAERSRSS